MQNWVLVFSAFVLVSGSKFEPLPHEKVLKLGGRGGGSINPIFQSIFCPNPISIPTFLFMILSSNDPDPIFPLKNRIGKSHLPLQAPYMTNLQDEVTYTLNQDISLAGCSTVARMLRTPSPLRCPSFLQ